MLVAAVHRVHGQSALAAEANHATGKDRAIALRQIERVHGLVIEPGCEPFPGGAFRPVGSQLNLRTFIIHPTLATHLRIKVLTSQCTGNPEYAGEQDADPRAATDCTTASQFAAQVRISEFQAFG